MIFRFDDAGRLRECFKNEQKPSKVASKRKKAISTHKKKDNAMAMPLKLFSEFGQGWVALTLPVRTVSEANGGAKKAYKRNGKTCYKTEHWTDRSKRHRKQKGIVSLALNPVKSKVNLPCHINLTRLAPGSLDKHDNLPMSMKYILDAVCEIITGDYRPGRADNDDRISISYDQVRNKEYGVKINITF